MRARATPLIFKIVSREDWERACRAGQFPGSADDLRDGFIHLSTARQLHGTAAKHFQGQLDLVLVAFDTAQLRDDLKWEVSRGGDLFPHLYGPLPAAAALWTKPLALGEDGVPRIPDEIITC